MVMQGTVLAGRYRLLDVLGDGGMARVFRAEDERLGRVVAIKVLHEHYLAQPEFVRRFQQEAHLAAGLSHPNIVAIYDVDRDGNTYFIVMEYVEGGSLKRLIVREAPLPLARVSAIMRQLGQALDTAHAHGVVHRDIKPENILLTPADTVKVSDFGIARALTSPGQTATGMVLGSVSYFSPEQAQGKPATAESDIYSSGIVLYEMLTGRLPFAGGNPLATAMQQITQAPAPPRSIVPTLPPAVDTVALRTLDKNPARRYPSGAALAEALATAMTPPAEPAPASPTWSRVPTTPNPSLTARPAPPLRPARAAAPPRRRAPVVPLLLLLLLGGGAVYGYVHRHDLRRLFAGGAPAAGSSTATPTAALPTLTPNGAPGSGPVGSVASPTRAAPATATATSAAIIAPNPTATSAAIIVPNPTATGMSTATATATAFPSATPQAVTTVAPPGSATATATTSSSGPGSLSGASADVITARLCELNGRRIPFAIGPQDSFRRGATVYALLRFHGLPARTRVGARWTSGGQTLYTWNAGSAYSSDAIYCANFPPFQPGTYAVAALANGKRIGAHTFVITAGHSTAGHSATQSLLPNQQAPLVAVTGRANRPSAVTTRNNGPSAVTSADSGSGRGKGHAHGPHAHGSGSPPGHGPAGHGPPGQRGSGTGPDDGTPAEESAD